MKTNLNFSAILIIFLISVFSISCSSDDEKSIEELFSGKYKGEISFIGHGTQSTHNDGLVKLNKGGEFWSLSFSDSIPEIDSLIFEISENERVMMNVNADEEHLIRITESSLQLIYNRDGEFWEAHCNKN